MSTAFPHVVIRQDLVTLVHRIDLKASVFSMACALDDVGLKKATELKYRKVRNRLTASKSPTTYAIEREEKRKMLVFQLREFLGKVVSPKVFLVKIEHI